MKPLRRRPPASELPAPQIYLRPADAFARALAAQQALPLSGSSRQMLSVSTLSLGFAPAVAPLASQGALPARLPDAFLRGRHRPCRAAKPSGRPEAPLMARLR